jgi:hypothetical protein
LSEKVEHFGHFPKNAIHRNNLLPLQRLAHPHLSTPVVLNLF